MHYYPVLASILLAYSSISFTSQTTTALQKIYENHRFTFFYQQPFTAKQEIVYKACAKCPTLTTSVQGMPLVSYAQMASDLLCFKEKLCLNATGQRFKGLRCCAKTDQQFQKMRLDLHNLVLEVPAMKAQRKHLTLPVTTRGMMARAQLYMHDTYHVVLTAEEVNLYATWHRQYPVSDWERERNDKIKALQGNGNPYVQ